jgi:hypothetical protein
MNVKSTNDLFIGMIPALSNYFETLKKNQRMMFFVEGDNYEAAEILIL